MRSLYWPHVATHPKLWYLEKLGLLGDLPGSEKEVLERETKMHRFTRSQVIFAAGDAASHLWLIKTGAVKIMGRTPDGRDALVALLEPGDVFGELAMFEDGPRTETAIAAEDSALCAIPRGTMTTLAQRYPHLGYTLTKLMGLRLRRLSMRVEELLCRSASARLAHAMMTLADRHGVADADGVLIPLRLSQADLGRLVGLSRETVNGIVRQWEDEGLVEMSRRAIRVRQPEALRGLGH